MEVDPAFQLEEDSNVQPILLAASQHDIATLRNLLRGATSRPANVRDADTGFTPLHSAIDACSSEDHGNGSDAKQADVPNGKQNGKTGVLAGEAIETEAALDTVRYLLQNGAIWNQLDNRNETPGCLALRLGLKGLYELMIDAGVRAEMLLSRLDEYEPLDDEDSGAEENKTGESTAETGTSPKEPPADSSEVQERSATTSDGAEYLASTLSFAPDRLLDSERNGVMMSWEKDIMEQSATRLVTSEGLRILNIGHGMGMIDEMFQSKNPKSHHIVEAHSEVLASMRANKWTERPGVVVHEGTWQEAIPKLIEEGQTFDVIYFDTFGEDYAALRRFFDEFVISLLEDNGRFGFFNGLGADRQICYDVYAKVVEMDLLECGFDVDWSTISVSEPLSEEKWSGVKRPYWTLAEYKLPIVTFLG